MEIIFDEILIRVISRYRKILICSKIEESILSIVFENVISFDFNHIFASESFPSVSFKLLNAIVSLDNLRGLFLRVLIVLRTIFYEYDFVVSTNCRTLLIEVGPNDHESYLLLRVQNGIFPF